MEYIRSAFLVQEWETAVNGNGSKKETLRLDLIDSSYDSYKDADVLVFNTGNWWTHEKTSQGYRVYKLCLEYYIECSAESLALDVIIFTGFLDTFGV